MLRTLRYLLVVVTWPIANIVDRIQGCDPPASFHRGLEWARGEHQPTIRTADKPAVVRSRPACADCGDPLEVHPLDGPCFCGCMGWRPSQQPRSDTAS